MQSKVGPAAIIIGIVVVIAFCLFLYMRTNRSQAAPSGGVYKPPNYAAQHQGR